ncbi:unnamed protein product [Malus baccata var. baccata]
MIWDTLAFNPDDMRYFCSGVACLQRDLLDLISPSSFMKMSGPSDHRFDLNFGEEAAMPSQDNIWTPSFLSPTSHLTIRDSVMKNDMTAAVVARNLLTPKDHRLLSKRSDELAVKDSLLSVFRLKHTNKQLHMLTHDYATNMKRKLDQLQEFDGQILLDHQRFVGLFQRHLLLSSSGVVPRNEAPNDQPSVLPPSGVLPSTEAPNDHPPVPPLSEALPTAETSPEQLL